MTTHCPTNFLKFIIWNAAMAAQTKPGVHAASPDKLPAASKAKGTPCSVRALKRRERRAPAVLALGSRTSLVLAAIKQSHLTGLAASSIAGSRRVVELAASIAC